VSVAPVIPTSARRAQLAGMLDAADRASAERRLTAAAERAAAERRSAPPLIAEEWVRFRTRIVDALVRIDPDGFWYIDQDTVAGTCPLCGGIVSVYFAGTAARAEIICRQGCAERDVFAALGRLA
jgi:hypothetical protein